MANKRALARGATGTVGDIIDTDALFAKDMMVGDFAITPDARLHVVDNGMPHNALTRLTIDDADPDLYRWKNTTAAKEYSAFINNIGRFKWEVFDGNFAGWAHDGDVKMCIHTGALFFGDGVLTVAQENPAGAMSVLVLDQTDDDEPFIKYHGAAAAANIVNDLVAEASVTTATRIGFIKIDVNDFGNQITDQEYFVPFYTLT